MKNIVKIAIAAPNIKLCEPSYNASLCIECAKAADANGADIIVFPELALTGATCGDLFFQELLTESAESAFLDFVKATEDIEVMCFIGLPIKRDGAVYNAVACVSEGEILGITASGAKTRHFASAPDKRAEIDICGQDASFGRDLIYTDEESGANIFVKVGEDNAFSADGVNVILNPIAMPEYLGLKKERSDYAAWVSSELGLTYVIAGAGEGESGTDGIYAAPRVVYQNGYPITEAELFGDSVVYSTVDLKKKKRAEVSQPIESKVLRSPFIPEDETEREEACALALELQARALALRMQRAYAKTAVLGVSGGLDSTLAVLVAAKAMDILGRGRDNVIAITMPCFGTTERTKSNALALAEQLSCSVRTIDIKASVNQHFSDIGHDPENYNVVYENSQARERTQILMDVANMENGLVVGTGDLSELALGFATYNGDHMSMYCVNGSVPKTLMRAIIAHAAKNSAADGNEKLAEILFDVINTPVSPELLPTEDGDTENKQHTESIVGPYELHDFFIYYTVKYGYSPSKVYALAMEAFSEYAPGDIKQYLEIFVKRFFAQQFKRSCMPDGPRVTEISFSPRGSWQMPSDSSSAIWRADISSIN